MGAAPGNQLGKGERRGLYDSVFLHRTPIPAPRSFHKSHNQDSETLAQASPPEKGREGACRPWQDLPRRDGVFLEVLGAETGLGVSPPIGPALAWAE